MKLVTAYLHHIRAAEVVQALADAGFRNLVLTDVRGTLPSVSDDERDYSTEGAGLVIGAVRLDLVCQHSEAASVAAIIRAHAAIGPRLSGWVYISTIDEALPIGSAS
ncbi:MAG: P-II family nitrogen regulator [Reyranella sp.]